MRCKPVVAACVAVIIALSGFAAVANAASTGYYVSYGGGDYVTKGNIDWYNRTVSIGGSVKAIEYNCARVTFYVESGIAYHNESRTACSETKTFGFDVSLEVPGGPQQVTVELAISNGSSGGWTVVGKDRCVRGASSCTTL